MLKEDCDCLLCQCPGLDLEVNVEILFLECDKLYEELSVLPAAHAYTVDTATPEDVCNEAALHHESILHSE